MPWLALQSAVGLAVLVFIAWALSERRSAFSTRQVLTGVAIQIGVALLMLKLPAAQQGLLALNAAVDALTQATQAGTGFVFGYLGGGPAPYEITKPANAFVLGFQALPLR